MTRQLKFPVSRLQRIAALIAAVTCLVLTAQLAGAQQTTFPNTAPRVAPTVAPKSTPKAAPKTAAPVATVPTPYGEVRSACQFELKATCAGVVPGSADSVQCLRRNIVHHAPLCQAAIARAGNTAVPTAAKPDAFKQPAAAPGTATAPRRVSTDSKIAPPAQPAEPPVELRTPALRATQEARFVNRFCKGDHALLCQGVPYGQGRVLKCLAGQQASLSGGCKNAMAAQR